MRNRIFLALDILLSVAVVFAAFSARFDGGGWWPQLGHTALVYIAVAIPVKIALFYQVGLYSRLWRYASIADLEIVLVAGLLGAVVSVILGLFALPLLHLIPLRVPAGVLVIDGALTAGVITLPRLVLRIIARRWRAKKGGIAERARIAAGFSSDHREPRRVLIAGAGNAGGMIARELLEHPNLGLSPVGFVDDDPTKHGHRLHGLRVYGAISAMTEIIGRLGVEEVIIALPAARGKVIRDIMQQSIAAGVRNRTVPGLYEILSGAKSVSALRPIQIEDLLRRDPIETDNSEIEPLVSGRTVLVTGAGGSIGSELCRQLAQLAPSQLVVVGRGENSIFELLAELRVSYPYLVVKPAIVDVRDEVRLRAIFESTTPYSVFHAAAHKHVPLMEASVDEAILNNVLGTRNVAELCAEFSVQHLVLISTDKAVRPTSIMGATKRIAEYALCAAAARTGLRYVSVRFGNVLGSRGSVVPTFMRQIASGGPITITHPDMRRYFMTIPEAVQLVLQAAAMGHGGEVFVLDMGEPVRIADLAQDLIRLSGLEVDNDIEICYTGMRPGEKLYEELFFGPDDATPTDHPKILKARDGSASAEVEESVDALIDAARRRAPESELRRMIHFLVPEYCHPTISAPQPERIVSPAGPRAPASAVGVARDRGSRSSGPELVRASAAGRDTTG